MPTISTLGLKKGFGNEMGTKAQPVTTMSRQFGLAENDTLIWEYHQLRAMFQVGRNKAPDG
jgi:hypothetical protein